MLGKGDGLALEVRGLKKTFYRTRGKPIQAVNDVSFTVEKGEVVGLLGPNGAGKTTIIKGILGLVEIDAGHVRINGYDPRRQRWAAMAQVAAVLEGARNIYWRLSPWENLEFFAGLHGISRREGAPYWESLLERFGLTEHRNTPVNELSQGNKQKVAVASALAKRTPVVFLDEPTLGLDVETSHHLRETLRTMAREEGRTIILSSHDMDVVQDTCRRVIIIVNGRVIADDSLEHLLDIFHTRDYRFELAHSLPEPARQRLKASFAGVTFHPCRDGKIFTVPLQDGREIYNLIDLLRELGAIVAAIHQQEPDLERAFLELVRKERATKHA